MGKQSNLKAMRRAIRAGIPENGTLPPWTPWARLPDTDVQDPETWRLIREQATTIAQQTARGYADTLANVLHRMQIPHYQNSRYHVAIDTLPDQAGHLHLDVRRRDNLPLGPEHFRDLQRIKNELVGPEHEAVEVYPAESRLRDAGNNYHLWVLPKGQRFPFGFPERLVSYTSSEYNTQAPREA